MFVRPENFKIALFAGLLTTVQTLKDAKVISAGSDDKDTRGDPTLARVFLV